MEKIFQSVEESPEPQNAEVTGSIPDWVEGHLFRAGPAKWDFEDGFTLNHFLDGSALVYKFTIEKGQVSVRSKFLDSEAYQKLSEFNRLVYTEFGTRSYPDLCKSLFQRVFAQFLPMSFTDNTFANICMLEDEMYVFSETNNIWKVNPEDLSCVEKTDITNVVSVNAATSHPHKTSNGTIYNLGSSVITGLKYHVMKIPPPTSAEDPKTFERAIIHSTISSSYNASLGYYHSFGMSENYILLIEQPLLVNTLKMAVSGIAGYCLRDLLEWYPNEKVIFHLMDLRTGIQTTTKYVANAFFFFHHINTYEEDGHVVADIMAYSDAEVLDLLFLDKLRLGTFPDECVAITTRFVLPLETDGKEGSNLITLKNTNAVAIKQDKDTVLLISETKGLPGFEIPTINYSMFNAKKYRYVYSTSYFYQGDVANTLRKLDVVTEEMKTWKESSTMFPSELVYVPRPGSTLEDDGILLSVVKDVEEDARDFLLVLDARTFKVLAKAFVPRSVQLPNTLHGIFQRN